MDVSKEKKIPAKQDKVQEEGSAFKKAQWKPGQSGNPKGRAKRGNTLADLIRDIGDQPYKDEQKTLRNKAIEALWTKAGKGDVAAFKALTDRTEGFPRQSVEIDNRPKDSVKVIG